MNYTLEIIHWSHFSQSVIAIIQLTVRPGFIFKNLICLILRLKANDFKTIF